MHFKTSNECTAGSRQASLTMKNRSQVKGSPGSPAVYTSFFHKTHQSPQVLRHHVPPFHQHSKNNKNLWLKSEKTILVSHNHVLGSRVQIVFMSNYLILCNFSLSLSLSLSLSISSLSFSLSLSFETDFSAHLESSTKSTLTNGSQVNEFC